MNRRIATILILFGVVFLICGGWWVFKVDKVSDVDEVVKVDDVEVGDLPEGVEIVERDGERILENNRDGYEVKVGDGLEVIYHDAKTVSVGGIQKSTNPSSEGYEITVYDEKVDNIGTWLHKWIEDSNCPECYTSIIQQDTYYRVDDVGSMGTVVNYFWQDVNKIYQITIFDGNSDIKDVIKEINFTTI